MQVTLRMQRKGVGTLILNAIIPFLDGKECFCVSYRGLVSFYKQIGFVEVDASECPAFLEDRVADYRRKLDEDVVIMRKPAIGKVEVDQV
jgi:GNAT superfamily N-acetyltransferase